jgi:hypothetical protein
VRRRGILALCIFFARRGVTVIVTMIVIRVLDALASSLDDRRDRRYPNPHPSVYRLFSTKSSVQAGLPHRPMEARSLHSSSTDWRSSTANREATTAAECASSPPRVPDATAACVCQSSSAAGDSKLHNWSTTLVLAMPNSCSQAILHSMTRNYMFAWFTVLDTSTCRT